MPSVKNLFFNRLASVLTLAAAMASCLDSKKASPAPRYTITFHSHGSHDLAPAMVERDKLATPPVRPIRPNGPHGEQYSFQGWYSSSSGGQQFDFATTPITAPIALYARWTQTPSISAMQPTGSYTVAFNTQGGSEVEPMTIESGKLAPAPAQPTHPAGPHGEQYSFQGWYSSSSGGNRFDFATAPIRASFTLYAQWTATQSNTQQPNATQPPASIHVLTFNTQGGSDVESMTIESGQALIRPTDPTHPNGPHGERYNFKGWYNSPTGGVRFDFGNAPPIIDSFILYAYWGSGYTITFHTDGGMAIDPLIVANDTPPKPPQEELSKKDASTIFDRPLEGWYTDANFQDKFNFDNPITADITLYAKYDQNIYLISTEAQLREMGKYLSSHFRLHNDIELQSNWTPLGGAGSGAAFTGRFEGGGHIIKGLKINASNSNTGLFSFVDTGGVVEAVGLENVSIKGIENTGALAGVNLGSVSGYVVGGTVEGTLSVGGLVGYNGGGLVAGYATVEVTGDARVGGLVGYNNGHAAGYSTGKVTCRPSIPLSYSGGLVGVNRSAFIGYARGSVARAMGATDTSFGLLSFNDRGTAAGYHSGKAGESQLIGITVAEHTGYDGNSIIVSLATQESDFKGLTFGSEPSQWTFKAGHWPAINLKGIPLDRQDEITKP